MLSNNRPSLPGFTAEASLQHEYHRPYIGQSGELALQAVVPQQCSFDTACAGVVLFCRNYCYENGNKVWKGWWYPCGGCVGCFLSTACVSARGLADNCVELTTLRRFRDQYLLSTPAGKQLVEEYYRIAPAICTAIETRADAGRVYDHLYRELVEPSVALVESGQLDEALLRYRRVTLALRDHLKA